MNKEQLIGFGSTGAVGGAITALCLRPFTTLPALAIGGIIGAGAFVALAAVLAMMFYWKNKDSRSKDQILFLPLLVMCVNSTAIGVGLATALTSEVFAKWYTAIAAGAVIGAIGLVGGFLALEFFTGKSDQPPTSPNPTVKGINVTAEGANATGRSPELRTANP